MNDRPPSLDYLALLWSLVAVAVLALAAILFLGRLHAPERPVATDAWRRDAPYSGTHLPRSRPGQGHIDAVLIPTAALALLLPVTLVAFQRRRRWAYRVLQGLSAAFAIGLLAGAVWGLRNLWTAASRVSREHDLAAGPAFGLYGIAALLPLAALLFALLFGFCAVHVGRNLPSARV